MSLKKLGIAMLAVFVLGAIAANSAFAENGFKEVGSQWYTGTAESHTKLTGSTGVTVAKVSETLKLNTTAGGSPLVLKATGISCSGTCNALNSGTNAIAEGALKFTGVTVVEPANCSVEGGEVVTKALKAIVGMGGAGSEVTVKFEPVTPSTFATVKIIGGSCPIASTYKVTGVAYAKAANATSVFKVTQDITLSETIQKEAGTATSLKFGENAAYLTGEVSNTFTVSIGATEK